jgi:acetyl-CoA C-acetyltransferase
MGVCGLCTESMNLVEDQDNYAIQSYERSAKAWELKIDQEVVPVAVPKKR